jgi:D-alanyl-lipoteichoic acid acyltransferase DltB (MBOAT superfamily)
MIFNSYTFVLFIGLVLLLHYLPLAWKTKKINLLLASYLFYAVWNPPFVLLLWLSTVVDYLMARWLDREENPGKRKALLGVSLAVNLGMLGFLSTAAFSWRISRPWFRSSAWTITRASLTSSCPWAFPSTRSRHFPIPWTCTAGKCLPKNHCWTSACS